MNYTSTREQIIYSLPNITQASQYTDLKVSTKYETQQGIPGKAATIEVGNVSVGYPTSITNVGTENAAIFDFVIEQGPQGETGPQGPQGAKGDTGAGVPTGGIEGQYLIKKSSTDYDTEWGTLDTDDIGATFSFKLANDNTTVGLYSYNYNSSSFYNNYRFNRINWGDGTPIETFESESVAPSTSHTYEKAGLYTIRCYKENAVYFHVYINLNNAPNVEAHIGKGVGAFGYSGNTLEALDWGFWNSELISDRTLLYLVEYPSGYDKRDLVIPSSVGTICNIKGKAPVMLYGIEKITIKGHPYENGPLEWKSITNDCSTLKELIFEQPEVWNLGPSYSPGTLSLPQDTKVIVPWSADHSVLSAWKANQYWSPYASQIVEASAPTTEGIVNDVLSRMTNLAQESF